MPPGNRAVYAYARSGLRAALAELGLGPGDTALLPAFISSSAVWPFHDLGIDVSYYPVTRSLSLRSGLADRIERLEPEVVLFVHYLGFPDQEFGRLAAAARDVGATVVEDCARGLFSRDDQGRLLGTTGDISLFSLRKVLPAPHGGLVVASEAHVPQPATSIPERSYLVSALGRPIASLLPERPPSTTPSITEIDRNGDGLSAPSGPPDAAPGRLSRLGLSRSEPTDIARARRDRYSRVRDRLRDVPELELLTPAVHDGGCPYGVAVRLPGGPDLRDRLFHRLRRLGFPAERFRWRMAYGEPSLEEFPGAVELHDTMLVVPTHQALPWRIVDATADALVDELRDGDS